MSKKSRPSLVAYLGLVCPSGEAAYGVHHVQLPGNLALRLARVGMLLLHDVVLHLCHETVPGASRYTLSARRMTAPTAVYDRLCSQCGHLYPLATTRPLRERLGFIEYTTRHQEFGDVERSLWLLDPVLIGTEATVMSGGMTIVERLAMFFSNVLPAAVKPHKCWPYAADSSPETAPTG